MLKTTKYTELQDFFPIVRIRSPHPLTRKEVLLLSPLGVKGRDTLACWGGVRGDPIPTKGQTLWYSMYVYYNPSTLKTLCH
jgi:hypothetical protein